MIPLLDPELEVYCYEEGAVPIHGPNPGPFDIVDASNAQVEIRRVAGKPAMRFGGSKNTKTVAIIGISPEF